ncbi:SRPBCC family protein [Jatrophihabitans fulvus]
MPRTDRTSLVIPAPRARVFAALLDRDALERWLPPGGMTGCVERHDPRPGGGYRMVLAYADGSSGKTGDGTDVVEARYVDIVENVRIVQAVDFVSDQPEFAGTMTMTWLLEDADGGTLVEFRADDVPDGISAGDHEAGLGASLRNLSAYVGG